MKILDLKNTLFFEETIIFPNINLNILKITCEKYYTSIKNLDLNNLYNLTILDLKSIDNLENLYINKLINLTNLNLELLGWVKIFSIDKLINLNTLNLKYLDYIFILDLNNLTNLTNLVLDSLLGLKELYINKIKNLKYLDIDSCHLEILDFGNSRLELLTYGYLPNLKYIDVYFKNYEIFYSTNHQNNFQKQKVISRRRIYILNEILPKNNFSICGKCGKNVLHHNKINISKSNIILTTPSEIEYNVKILSCC